MLNPSNSENCKITNDCATVAYGHEKGSQNHVEFVTLFRDPDATRTHDRLLRRQMLYPAELPDRPFDGWWQDNPYRTVFRVQR